MGGLSAIDRDEPCKCVMRASPLACRFFHNSNSAHKVHASPFSCAPDIAALFLASGDFALSKVLHSPLACRRRDEDTSSLRIEPLVFWRGFRVREELVSHHYRESGFCLGGRVPDSATAFTSRTDLQMKVSFGQQPYGSSTVSDLVFVLSAYDMKGATIPDIALRFTSHLTKYTRHSLPHTSCSVSTIPCTFQPCT